MEMLDTEDLITKERDQLYATSLQVRTTLRHSWQPIGMLGDFHCKWFYSQEGLR